MKVQTYVLSTFLFALLPPGVFAGPIAAIAAFVAVTGTAIGTIVFGVLEEDKKNDRKEKSEASTSSMASVSASLSLIAASEASSASVRASDESKAMAQVASITSAQAAALSSLDPALNVFTFDDPATRSKRSIQPEETSTPYLSHLMRRMDLNRRTIAINSTGWPIAPVGVLQFNFDNCALDLRAHLTNGGFINVFQPEGEPQTVQADHIPPNCMVLANVILASGGIGGAQPIAFGTASLKWLHVTDQEINDLKAFLQSGGKGPIPP
ncbi:hypothetical protein LTR70_008359 [Exophiala xenobiotica]|uniref:Uncharacterized protein n=1 Tax=Lithohypha guttulata TaxID=1690604 RepID=A0ABR0JWB8_9EURO|nr:hypothetical protein LTR24_009945 [Lithohypha guttulata]KAK5312179.1 hypothetical protein LTR70_008359 [Exophiala xenobiotica]